MVGLLDSTTYVDGSVERAFSWTWKQQWLNDALAIGVIDEGYERFNFSVCVYYITSIHVKSDRKPFNPGMCWPRIAIGCYWISVGMFAAWAELLIDWIAHIDLTFDMS